MRKFFLLSILLTAFFISVFSQDQTSYFNTQFARSVLYQLEVGSEITISGTVTIPAGKVLKFKPGGKLVGAGTINGGIIDANVLNQIFDTTLTVNPEGTKDGVFSARWFGASPSVANNQPALQKAINTCIANDLPKLYLPPGQYDIAKGLLFYVPGGQVQTHFYSDIKAQTQTSKEAMINCTHNDNFCIGVQVGKGWRMDNISIRGVNQLNYSLTTAHTEGTTYLTNGSRDNRYSPYAGVVFDPFHSNVTGSDRYPGFESYYSGVTTQSGSTSCQINNCFIDGFTVARVMSPNGTTFNNESHVFSDNWIANCREGYVACNSQERNNTIINDIMWNSVKTCYSTYGYGALNGDPPFISGTNVAGNIYEFIIWQGSGYSPALNIENVHAESLYRIGIINGQARIVNSKFLFQITEDIGLGVQETILNISNGNIVFDNCLVYCYGGATNRPLRITGTSLLYGPHRIKFVNSVVSPPSFVGDAIGWEEYNSAMCVYENTSFYGLGGKIVNKFVMTGFDDYSEFYGSSFLIDIGSEIVYNGGSFFGISRQNIIKHKVITPVLRSSRYGINVIVTRTGDSATFDVTDHTELLGVLKEGDGIWYDGGHFGTVIDVDGNDILVSGLIESFVSDTYNLHTTFLQHLKRPFIGNLSSGTPTKITNVLDIGNWIVGDRIGSPYTGLYIMSIDTTTITLSAGIGVTANDVVFSQYDYEESGYTFGNPTSAFADGVSCRRGTRLTDITPGGTTVEWICTKSGVFGTANAPTFDQISLP